MKGFPLITAMIQSACQKKTHKIKRWKRSTVNPFQNWVKGVQDKTLLNLGPIQPIWQLAEISFQSWLPLTVWASEGGWRWRNGPCPPSVSVSPSASGPAPCTPAFACHTEASWPDLDCWESWRDIQTCQLQMLEQMMQQRKPSTNYVCYRFHMISL